MNIDDYLFGYAMLDNTDHVVEIDEFNKETCSQHKFSCPFCNGEMYPTYGRVQRHHFRHNGNKCNRDDYLHSLAEHVFKEEFLKCIEQDTPFVLELHTPVYCSRSCLNIKSGKCSTRENIIYIDLAKRYRSITVEKNITVGDHYRRPDILLISEDGEQLWVEIWVKHETVLEKRQEGQILEIKISSEKDIEQIRNHKVVSEVNNSAVRLFNSVINQGRGVFKKSIVDTESCTDIKTIPKAPQIQYSSKPAFRKNYYKEIQRSYSEHLPSFDEKKVEWIDLGLPSGTLWAKNDQEETISFKNARFLYKYYLP